MIVVDTNVVSEIMRPRPDASVLAWFDYQPPDVLWLNSIVAAELMLGVAKLAVGARKRQLVEIVRKMLEDDFADRVLTFDLASASVYAEICAQRERVGRPIAISDAQIAAICLAHGTSLATRNERHFDALELNIINPWNYAA